MVKNNSRRGVKLPPATSEESSTNKVEKTALKRKAGEHSKNFPYQRSPVATKLKKTSKAKDSGQNSDEHRPLTRVVEGRLLFIHENDKKQENRNSNSVSALRSRDPYQSKVGISKLKGVSKESKEVMGIHDRNLRSKKFIIDQQESDLEMIPTGAEGAHFIADGVRVDVVAPEETEDEGGQSDNEQEELDYDDQDLEEGQYPEEDGSQPQPQINSCQPGLVQAVPDNVMVNQIPTNTHHVDEEIVFNFRDRNQEAAKNQEAQRLLADNPHLGNIFQEMIQKGVQEEVKRQMQQSTGKQGNEIRKIAL